ncbi:MAG: hypothetical protein ACYDCK_06775 [Thermoplasmatota archaeon]
MSIMKMRPFTMTMNCREFPALVRAAGRAGLRVEDTGERVTTDEGIGDEMVVRIHVPARGEPVLLTVVQH